MGVRSVSDSQESLQPRAWSLEQPLQILNSFLGQLTLCCKMYTQISLHYKENYYTYIQLNLMYYHQYTNFSDFYKLCKYMDTNPSIKVY